MNAAPITEKAFQAQVLDLAALKGWRTFHARPAQNQRGDWRTPVAGDGKGFPDLVLVRDQIIFAELKSNTGRLRKDQRAWLDELLFAVLQPCHECGGPGDYVRVEVWRPDDWDRIVEILS